MARKTQLLYPGDLIALEQRTGVRGDQKTDFMHKDTPFGELALISPNGQHHPRLDWQHELPVPLLKNVQRLTCGNPGVMTGPGTNSYIVGDVTTGHIVIDPGPNEAEHLQRLWQACGGDIRMIVCTHSHPDHSPGALPLKALCQAQGKAPPILGLSSLPTARANSQFSPERELIDGERLVLSGPGIQHTLRVVFTDRKSTRLNSSHSQQSRMPSSA